VLGDTLARLEKLARRFEKKSGELRASAMTSGELAALLARFEALADRLEQLPSMLPELPADAFAERPLDAEGARELEALRAAVLFEQESRRQTDDEVRASKEKLRSFRAPRASSSRRATPPSSRRWPTTCSASCSASRTTSRRRSAACPS